MGWRPPQAVRRNTPCRNSPSRTERPGEATVQGTIAWANRERTQLRLDNGTELTVPTSVHVVPTSLNLRRSIKAYYVKEDGKNVVTMMEVAGAQPGTGADVAAG
jgi:hypothetical protein